MENSNFPRNHLGINKMGKNIRKSPLHQPNFGNTTMQQPLPQVYNIGKNDFRNIVQQLTGSPLQDPLPRPPSNPPKSPSMRLQKIRPPPLTPISRPPAPMPPSAPAHFSNSFVRPHHHGQPSHSSFPPMPPGDSIGTNTAESPVSAYMRYLIDSGPRHPPPHHSSSGLLPTPPVSTLPLPQANVPPLLPSPTSQFLLPSPSGFLNLFSPRSPYPLLSPGFQYPPPLTPNFSYSPSTESGILGPGPQPPSSPRIFFPSSPSGFFPISSPKWRDQ